jgi:hypothetical protein
LIPHEISDGGLATSTQRLAVNTGYVTSKDPSNLFSPGAKPVHFPKLDAFLSTLKSPSFSPWTDILTTEEIQEYQRGNHRKFPLLHLIPNGLSLSDLKSNRLERELLPGIGNDCWRFLVDVIILTAGSPYGKYLTVDLFRSYTRAIISVFVNQSQEGVIQRVLEVTGGGSMGLVVSFLISLLLLYKCHRLLRNDRDRPKFDEVCFLGRY